MERRTRGKIDRNERLYKFYSEHPTWTLESIGKLFKISKARVSIIIKVMEAKQNPVKRHNPELDITTILNKIKQSEG